MARRKQAALEVPASAAEAEVLIADYVATERQALVMALNYEMQIDKLKSERATILALIEADQKPVFAALKAWWEAGGKAAAGGLRSAELAGAKIGVRLTPKSVKFARGVTAAKVVDWLKTVKWSKASELLRTKVELDKAAIIKCVVDSQGEEDMLAEIGVSVVQTDEFFIDAGLDEEAMRKTLVEEGRDG